MDILGPILRRHWTIIIDNRIAFLVGEDVVVTMLMES